jgi:glycerol kinase
MKYILSIDEGTTGVTVLLIDKNMGVAAKINTEFKQYYPQPSWVEHDAEEIWNVTVKTIGLVLAQARASGSAVAAIGITNQRETTVLWDRITSQPVHPAIVWQDRRTALVCDRLRKNKTTLKTVREKTGLVLDPYFSATKIAWILKNVPHARELAHKHQLAFGTMDSWLTWHLTGGEVHVTDVSNASRTSLMDLNTLRWDEKLLKIFGVPTSVLPPIKSCSEIYGETKNVAGLPDGIPIAGMAGDQQAALFGQACFTPGDAKCTYGTGSFLLMNIGKKPVLSKSGLLTTVAWQLGKNVTYALEGSAFIAGAAVQWLRDELKLIEHSSDIEALAQTVADCGGVYFVPALAGLGAPHWQANARGLLCGLTRGSNRGHIARAVLEGVALSQYDILSAMQKDGKKKMKILKVDGGAVDNNLLMQFQADVLGCQITRPKITETTAFGAAFLAGLAVGFWQNQEEIQKAFKVDQVFTPQMSAMSCKQKIAEWEKAVDRTKW